MKKHEIELPEYFDRYINHVEDIELFEALNKYGANMFIDHKQKLIDIGDKVYSPGKWTVKDIIQHVIDAERVFDYRALSFARNEKALLASFNEDEYAEASNANDR